jgi:hypothetical protein
VRTLQRRLRSARVKYAGVLQQVRCQAAEQMLADSARAIGDVARALGYSDPAHFTRAFVRWTGLAPREFRRLRVTGCSGTPEPKTPVVRRGRGAGTPEARRPDHRRHAATAGREEPRPVVSSGAGDHRPRKRTASRSMT